MRENREHGREDGEGGEEPAEARAERRGTGRDRDHERRRDRHARRKVPDRQDGDDPADRLWRHGAKRERQGRERDEKQRKVRQGERLQAGGGDCVGARSGAEGDAASGALGGQEVAKAETGLRGRARERTCRCLLGEVRSLVEREEEGHRAGGQRQADEPAADRLTPAAPGKARREDEKGRQRQLERQGAHRPPLPAALRPVGAKRTCASRHAPRRGEAPMGASENFDIARIPVIDDRVTQAFSACLAFLSTRDR